MLLKTFRNTKSKSRDKLIYMVRKMFDLQDDGVNALLSALNDFRDYVIVLYDNNELVGAISYYISRDKNYIEIDHLGVTKKKRGYGTILINEVFKIAQKLDIYPVTVVTNGYSNDFYEKMGMKRITKTLPAVYEMTKKLCVCM